MCVLQRRRHPVALGMSLQRWRRLLLRLLLLLLLPMLLLCRRRQRRQRPVWCGQFGVKCSALLLLRPHQSLLLRRRRQRQLGAPGKTAQACMASAWRWRFSFCYCCAAAKPATAAASYCAREDRAGSHGFSPALLLWLLLLSAGCQ